MPTYKVDHFFELQGQGWGETYYMQAADPAAMYSAQLPLFYARTRLLAYDTVVKAIRISDVAINRDSSLARPPSSYRFINTSPADRVGNARLIRMESNSLYWRHLMMRGVPDSIFDLTPGGNSDQVAWRALLADYALVLTGDPPYAAANKVFIYALDKPVGNETKIIAFLPGASPGLYLVTTDVALAVNTGDKVKLYLARDFQPPASVLTVINVVNANQFNVAFAPNVVGTVSQKAYIRKVHYTAQPVTYSTDLGATHRNTGRPFGLQRGRRSR